jgi:hypothetical protein
MTGWMSFDAWKARILRATYCQQLIRQLHNGEVDVNKVRIQHADSIERLTMLRLTIIAGGSHCCDMETGCDESVLHSNMAYTAATLLDLIEAIVNAVGGGALNRIRINNLKYLNQM